MKRKRKSTCPSPLLDESPKRTKVHAQRKFAQGSNVNTPIITPMRELESEIPKIDVSPEPVELLPMQRPNTEDFLTFLCFRGTPILPQNLNFFNTASIVDTNGQVHEIKSESSPKNGPIDIAKCGTSAEKPFIAFGVRKRADPIVISRQMDRKRRHALAIQALRRKYQEQKMAKIRALTISKLSEKVTNKTMVKTNTVSKTETVTKKSNTLQKTKVIATKHVKVTTQTLKTTLRPKIKPKMCLRSFRGRFVQKELPFRKKVTVEKTLVRKPLGRKIITKKEFDKSESSDDDKSLLSTVKRQPSAIKVNKRYSTATTVKTSPRVTRSGVLDKNSEARRKQIKKRILMTNPNTIVKPRSLRLTTLKKTVISQKKCNSVRAKQKFASGQKQQSNNSKVDTTTPIEKTDTKSFNMKPHVKISDKTDPKPGVNKTQKKGEQCKTTGFKKVTDYKKLVNKSVKEISRSADTKKDAKKTIEIKKSTRISNIVQKKNINAPKTAFKKVAKPTEVKTGSEKNFGKKRPASSTKLIKQTFKKETSQNSSENTPELSSLKTNTKKVMSQSIERVKKFNTMSDKVIKTVAPVPKKLKSSLIAKERIKVSNPRSDTDNKDEITEESKGKESLSNKILDEKSEQKIADGKKVKTELMDNEKDVARKGLARKTVQKKNEEAKKEMTNENTVKNRLLGKDHAGTKDEVEENKAEHELIKKIEPCDTEDELAIDESAEDVQIVSEKMIEKKLTNEQRQLEAPEDEIKINTELKKSEMSDKIKDRNSDIAEEILEDLVTTRNSKKDKNADVDDKEEITRDVADVCVVIEDNIKKGNPKKAKGKMNRFGSLEDVENLINITDKMKKLETGSGEDTQKVTNWTEENESSSEDIVEKDKSKKAHEAEESSGIVSKSQKISLSVTKSKKVNLIPSKKDTETRRMADEEKISAPRTTQRPSRKSKEAAAIYMEILSHKLVNDHKVDDDNVSIDSFPELPNVKKTQQRENELKAKAKTTKGVSKERSKTKDTADKDKVHRENITKTKTIDEKLLDEQEDDLFPPEEIPDDIKLNELKNKLESIFKQDKSAKKAIANREKKSEDCDSLSDLDSEENARGAKQGKSVAESEEEEVNNLTTRKTRNSSHHIKSKESYDSDESFHIDVRVPRKKKVTRSKATMKPVKPKTTDTSLEKTETDLKALSSSCDSDQSTTSDINLQTLANKAKNKKFSKTKSMKKPEHEFSDSDEEPLSKLTNQSTKASQKSESRKEESCRDTIKSPSKAKSSSLKTSPKPAEVEVTRTENVKPKRECAKIPQNYLPMLSSSDEDEIFHGFDEKHVKNVRTALSPNCSHAPPLLDLLHKDLGKRFGKEKVNMSNEQIEKWLKDSALAGSGIKKENDEMLKFGERIPTESSLDAVETIDTAKLSLTLLDTTKPKEEEASSNVDSSSTTPVKAPDRKASDASKPQIDRKLIFRKCKKDAVPNVNAFSPENESSVYAFGEDNEDVISTPFRRPSRRPSSTATSRSEDESSKLDESSKTGHFRVPTLKQDSSKCSKEEPEAIAEPDENSYFYIPQNPCKLAVGKSQHKTLLKTSRSSEKLSESDDFKYKIPSSPSASSSSSAKLYKRPTQKQKLRPSETMPPVYMSDFPKRNEPAKLVEAPIFHPTDQEFQDPLEYIDRIRHKAEQFGICRIVPPNSFKPECKVTDDMRFTAYDQYVHKMLYRWGPNFKELMAIKKYLETQNISLVHPPWIGGMEIDLPRLYQTVQTLGGLKEVIEKKKWPRVSELMKIPKSAQDRVTKLDDIYCKYLLPYDTLSPAEREKLFDEVETEWAKRVSRSLMKAQQTAPPPPEDSADGDSDDLEDNDVEECITKGRNMALSAFYRIARNTMSMHFKTNEPPAQEVEQEYWKHVTLRQNHICVNSGSIDCGNWGYGFAISKNSPFARHAWNLKVLTNNNGSVLRSLGPVMGVTVPTLHVGMVFSACCWYRDPHGLPWIEYLHTGGNKIWYGIPNSASDAFHSTLEHLVPNYCRNKELWLPSDTVMVPPNLLVENNVSLCRTVQEPGHFIVVFPKAFTSCLATGYVVSESVYFAPTNWLKTARDLFEALRNSSEPSMFSLDRLLLSITNDARCGAEVLRQVMPHVQELCDREKQRRGRLRSLGEMVRERLPIPEVNKGKKKKFQQGEEGDYECEVCKMSLFVSMVFDTQEGLTYCLDHGIVMIETKKIPLANCKFMFTYDDDELAGVPDKMRTAIENKLQKNKQTNKFAGMATLLHKV